MELKNPISIYKHEFNLVYDCNYHIVFCPKYRRRVLVDGIDDRFKELVLAKQAEYKYNIVEMEVMSDHVHLLLNISPKISPYHCTKRIKGYTSRILRQEFPSLKSRLPCLWTRSCFIATVGNISLDIIRKYIEEQKNV